MTHGGSRQKAGRKKKPAELKKTLVGAFVEKRIIEDLGGEKEARKIAETALIRKHKKNLKKDLQIQI